MKVSDLTAPLLDYWVARADGYQQDQIEITETGQCCIEINDGYGPDCPFHPSHHWKDGGPIIEREQIGIYEGAIWDGPGKPPAAWKWYACIGGRPNYTSHLEGDSEEIDGPTPLIAAMRAYVASKFGDDVPDLAT